MNPLHFLLTQLFIPLSLAVIFVLVAWRFYRRVRQESHRQRTLTWPRATAELGENDRLPPASRDQNGNVIFYRAELSEDYTFYARGEKYSGKQLAPGLTQLNAEQAKLFLAELGKHRRYEICYNPHDPNENFLTVGKPILTNSHLLLYGLLGVGLPLALYVFHTTLSANETLLYGGLLVLASLLVVACYFLFKSVYNLGKLLLPTPPTDELLDSLAEREGVMVGGDTGGAYLPR
jgi:hypothetical protein